MFTTTEAEILETYWPTESTLTNGDSLRTMTDMPSTNATSEVDLSLHQGTLNASPIAPPIRESPGHHRINTRGFMRSLVADRLQNGQPTSEKYTVTPLGVMIEVESLGSRGEVQERTIYLKIEPDVPETIVTEEQQLRFAMQKVIDNAIKFTEGGSITITVNLAKNSQVVEIRVVDTGCGISEESKSSLFKPHFQEDSSTSRSRDGLGLSLFNAKAHVRKNLGGDMTLEQSATEGPLKGSEFLIRLPITILEPGSSETPTVGAIIPSGPHPSRSLPRLDKISHSHSSSLELVNGSSLSTALNESPRKRPGINHNLASQYPLKILIAEDNPTNRNVAIGALTKLGYSKDKIAIAFDGLEAVKKFNESLLHPSTQRFDAILMDIWMPNLDGYQATAKIMELARTHGVKIKVVAVTADITEDCMRRAKAAGMQGFLAKPYKVLDIEHLILEHFAENERQ
jgi:CheY-like chemotaxis protein